MFVVRYVVIQIIGQGFGSINGTPCQYELSL